MLHLYIFFQIHIFLLKFKNLFLNKFLLIMELLNHLDQIIPIFYYEDFFLKNYNSPCLHDHLLLKKNLPIYFNSFFHVFMCLIRLIFYLHFHFYIILNEFQLQMLLNNHFFLYVLKYLKKTNLYKLIFL